ncbi:traB domain-containing protein-like [Physella acuta]|uniref:traB domain-containing protein-like n=1 Tax=Physella acuta TaxID=109671 RepID=UPI0027DD8A68|nr:traB domain-containing protein-like [Physella acuta]
MSQEVDQDDADLTTNNNTGHIVVDNAENNNVGGASLYNKEDDEESEHNDSTEENFYIPDNMQGDLMASGDIPSSNAAKNGSGIDDDIWLSEDEDEDENYTDDEADVDPKSLTRVPVPISDLPETVTLLERDGCLVYIVGTAHFSKESQDDVSKVIQSTKPHVIMVELCQSRVNILRMDEEKILEEAKNINFSTIQQVIKRNGLMQGILNILLLNMSAYITKELGMAPGGEFRVAFNEAQKLKGGCKFILGDRPIHITLRRALASLSIWQRLKLAYAILFSKEPITKEDVEKCKQKDMLEQMIEEMTGEFPALGRVFVTERDIFLAHSLRKVAQPLACPEAPDGKLPTVVVGVVGIGHVQGIKENWEKELNIDEICKMPAPSAISVITKWSFRLSLLGLLTYGCYRITKLTAIPWITAIIK